MKRRKDGRWLKVVTINGTKTYFYSTAETEKQALKDFERQLIHYKEKEFKGSHNFKILAEKMIEFQSHKAGYKTIENYTVALKHLSELNDYNIEDITPTMIQSIIDTMSIKQNYSFSSISKVKITFSLILDYAIVHENLPLHNYTKSIKIPKGTKKGKIHSPDDSIAPIIIKNADKSEFGMWAMILLCSGLRRGELAALQKKDIDFVRNEIYVTKSVEFISNQPHLKNMPKTETSIGTVPILEPLRYHLIKWCEDLKPNDFLFGKNKPLTETQIKKRWAKYCNEIGHKFKGHQLRHAYAKMIYEAGIDVKTAQRLLRHADFTTTMNIYTDFSKQMTGKSIEMLNAFANNLVEN